MVNKSNLDLPNLDLLRSIAVISVASGHLLVALRMEWIGRIQIVAMAPFGVYMFFVHTSLVLMWSLQRRPNTLDFYVRRAFRLYPLAILAIFFVAAAHIPVSKLDHGVFTGAPVTLYTVVLNSMLVNGLLGHANLLLGTLWTLSPEMFMYLLLPCLFFYARTVQRVWPLFVLWMFTVLMDRRIFDHSDVSSFGVLVPHFLAGVIAYVGFMKRRPVIPAWIFFPFIALLSVFFLTAPVPGIYRGWLVSIAMGLLLPSFLQIRANVVQVAAHVIAKYSYGIYLFHLITIYFGIEVLKGYSLAVRLTAVIVPLIAGVIPAYHLVEKPMIKLGARVAARLAHERGLPTEKSLEALEPAP